ncbi:MAG: DUF4102 domain-containing protein [Planctomycetes bacterium]|nr:DUF4102 domain-containing protein [Planctomycetota bacterium]
MAHKFPFTDDRLEALKPPERGELIVYDQRKPYLAMRVTSGGAKTFILYRRVRGAPRKIRLGALGEIDVREARVREGRQARPDSSDTADLGCACG